MIKLTEAKYEELEILLDAIDGAITDCYSTDRFKHLKTWKVQVLTAMQIVKDRDTTNQN